MIGEQFVMLQHNDASALRLFCRIYFMALYRHCKIYQPGDTYLQSLQIITCNICCKLEDNAWFASMCVDAALVAAFMQYQIFCTISTHIAYAEVHMID